MTKSIPTEREQRALPFSRAILVLGFISIVFADVTGLILATIALTLARNAEGDYRKDPESYRKSSFTNVKSGKLCAITGFIISIILTLSNLL